MGPEKKGKSFDAETIKNTAYHEAGHTVVAYFTQAPAWNCSLEDDLSFCLFVCLFQFLSATEYHSDADYNSRRVGVVVVVVHTFKNGLTFERLDRFASYLEGSCIRVTQ